MEPIKKVAAFHDLSGYGRCALTVVIPILSAMGMQVCPVPTAVLSAHTAFSNVVMQDMTDILTPWLAHWDALGIQFDCLYSGYLGSPAQVDIIIAYYARHPEAYKLVDPVMADDGKLYSTFDQTMVEEMRKLLREADIITPNLTEACLLADMPYHDSAWEEREVIELSRKLAALGANQGAITSIPLAGGRQCNASYDEDVRVHLFEYERVPMQYPGTGDAFASALAGALLRGKKVGDALEYATAYASMLARESFRLGLPPLEGTCLEARLDWLKENL